MSWTGGEHQPAQFMILGVHTRIRIVGMQTISPHFVFPEWLEMGGERKRRKTVSRSRGERAWERSVSSHPTLSLAHLNAGKTSSKCKVVREKASFLWKTLYTWKGASSHTPPHLDMTHCKSLSRCITLTVCLQVLSRITTRWLYKITCIVIFM